MRIGELADNVGVNTKTVRYYESIGLMPEPDRTRSGYRDYGPDALERLQFIRDAQASGLTLADSSGSVSSPGGVARCSPLSPTVSRWSVRFL